jgi:hypothetical protein
MLLDSRLLMIILLSVKLTDNAELSAHYFYTLLKSQTPSLKLQASQILKEKIWSFVYRVIQKDRLDFERLYFLNCTWYVNDLHNI